MSNPLLDLIVQGESGAAGYNAYNRGTYVDAHGGKHIRGPRGAIDFSGLTVGQVNDRQHLRGDDPDRLFAVGKYQVIPVTMDDAILKLGLDRDQAFTPVLQDRMFSEYLIVDKRPDIHGFITGQPGVTLEAAQRSLAHEWASFGDPDKGGASHYGGANHASITLAQSASALNQMRTSYQTDIAHGLSPAEAWKDVTASDQSPTQTHHGIRANANTFLHQGSRGDAVHTRLLRHLTASSARWAPTASVLVVNLCHRYVEDTDWEFSEFALYDLGQAVAHMTIQAQSIGLFARQFRAFDQVGIAAEFHVPEHWQVTYTVTEQRTASFWNEEAAQEFAKRQAANGDGEAPRG